MEHNQTDRLTSTHNVALNTATPLADVFSTAVSKWDDNSSKTTFRTDKISLNEENWSNTTSSLMNITVTSSTEVLSQTSLYYLEITRLIFLYALPIIFIFGTIGNGLAFCVFLRKKIRNSTTILLATLAASDFTYIVLFSVHYFSFSLT